MLLTFELIFAIRTILTQPVDVFVNYILFFWQGFYAVYRDVFKTLAEEDYLFMDDKDSDNEFPTFGDSQSDYEEVSSFRRILVS